jgi:hypothetical protein
VLRVQRRDESRRRERRARVQHQWPTGGSPTQGWEGPVGCFQLQNAHAPVALLSPLSGRLLYCATRRQHARRRANQ